MKHFFFLTLLLIVLSKEQIEEIDGVLQLTRKNFQQAINENPRLLVKFYIEECKYCGQMKPVFIKLAEMLKEYGFVLGEVNAQEHKVLAAKNNAKSYPTLKLFKDGVSQDFPNSSDSVQLLFEFALQNAYNQFTNLQTQEEIDLFIKRSNFAILKYVNNDDDLQLLAKDDLGIKYGIVVNPELQKAHPSKYTLYHKELPQLLNYDGEFNGLQEWISTNGYLDIFSFTEQEFLKAAKDKINLVGVIGVKNSPLSETLNKLAEQYKNKIRFVLIDPNQELPQKRLQYLIKKKSLLKNVIYFYNYNTQKTKTAQFEEESLETNEQIFQNLITELINGKETIKSEFEKYFQGDGDVQVLTSENFNEQVYENPNHVFVKFYAPWCGHCKQLAPIYEELAQELGRQDIVIAEVDYTVHRIQGIDIQGYPTLIFFKSEGNQKKQIMFDGARSVDGMKHFLLKQLDNNQSENQLTEESLKVNESDRVEIPNDGQVIQLTSENFEQIVLKSKQDVFVKFYAPWCGHCKAMSAEYVKLAESYKNSENVLIAELDATIHKIPIVEIKGFPTLIHFKKDSTRVQQIQYNGKRTVEAIKEFIEDNGISAQKQDL
ncbi:unnamed protein product [Paramecium sonneborni]|uniref:Thioredoxin domain-containing protein n=1 Tax=Paramecium sonneborni TaxID=65129 RepID=A0A8S1R799_9CILI|nr:unnamed protein product [Paramecium sonneborni]